MIKYAEQSGRPVYGLHHYVVDTAAEVPKLPTNCAMGSTATVIATGDEYIFNSSKQWIKQPKSGSGGSPSGSEDDIVVLNGQAPSDNIVIL